MAEPPTPTWDALLTDEVLQRAYDERNRSGMAILMLTTAKSRCCNAPIKDAGECAEGCCDKWRCSTCKRTWLVEVGD